MLDGLAIVSRIYILSGDHGHGTVCAVHVSVFLFCFVFLCRGWVHIIHNFSERAIDGILAGGL